MLQYRPSEAEQIYRSCTYTFALTLVIMLLGDIWMAKFPIKNSAGNLLTGTKRAKCTTWETHWMNMRQCIICHLWMDDFFHSALLHFMSLFVYYYRRIRICLEVCSFLGSGESFVTAQQNRKIVLRIENLLQLWDFVLLIESMT